MGPVVDAETGFQYLRARYFDPATGQFLTRDPIEAVTREAYGYVVGNPVKATFPSGHNNCEVGLNPLRWVATLWTALSRRGGATDIARSGQAVTSFGAFYDWSKDALPVNRVGEDHAPATGTAPLRRP